MSDKQFFSYCADTLTWMDRTDYNIMIRRFNGGQSNTYINIHKLRNNGNLLWAELMLNRRMLYMHSYTVSVHYSLAKM